MTKELKTLFNNMGKPNIANLKSIYDMDKSDVRELRARDNEMLNDYDNWENHEHRQLLINVINEWCETFRCYSLHY